MRRVLLFHMARFPRDGRAEAEGGTTGKEEAKPKRRKLEAEEEEKRLKRYRAAVLARECATMRVIQFMHCVPLPPHARRHITSAAAAERRTALIAERVRAEDMWRATLTGRDAGRDVVTPLESIVVSDDMPAEMATREALDAAQLLSLIHI